MDKYEARRLALRKLADSMGRGAITHIADKIGKSADYVSRMLYPPGKNGRKRIGEDTLDALIEAFPSSFGHLLGAPQVASSATQPGYVRYQVMGEGGAGPGVINQDYPEVLQEVELAEWQVREEIGALPSPERVKLLTVRGHSMAPRIRNGDVVFVDLEDRQMVDGGLFVVLLHGHALVKRLEIRTDGLHIVSLATPERPDVVAPDRMHDVSIAGRVLGAIQIRKADDL